MRRHCPNCWTAIGSRRRSRAKEGGNSTPTRTSPSSSTALEAAFTLKDEYGYKELAGVLRETYATVDVILGGNRVTDLITLLKNKRMIVQENGRKYTFKPDFHY